MKESQLESKVECMTTLKVRTVLFNQLLQQANTHQLLSQNQLNMVGFEIGGREKEEKMVACICHIRHLKSGRCDGRNTRV